MAEDIHVITFRRERQLTYDGLPPELQRRVVFVVDEQDHARWRKVYPSARFLRCPQQGKGSAEVRQWLVDRAKRLGSSLLIIVDDDLRFQQAHWEDDKKRFRLAGPAEIIKAFSRLEGKALETDVAFTSFSNPFFNLERENWGLCKYAMCAFFINMATLRKTGARFDGISNRSDLKFMIETWAAGYPSYNSMFFGCTNQGDSGVGGESLRDPATGGLVKGARPRGERQEEAHRLLAERFPRYIKLIERKHKRADQIGTTLDARVLGLKAYKENRK